MTNKDPNIEAFYEYELTVSSRLIRNIAAIIGLFNLLLLIPDLTNISDPSSRTLVIIYRCGFFIMAALLVVFFGKIKTFKKLAFILTVYEFTAVFIFLHVLTMYPDPDFTIQLLGTFIIILTVFLVPNLWTNMLLLSALIGTGFLLYSYLEPGAAENNVHFVASAVYIALEIALCSIFAYNFNRYKRGEFLARAELRRIYATDPLTKVGNRVKLDDEARKWMAYCKRHGLELSLVLVDVDNLKQINDEYGHLTGDALLYVIAQTMSKQLRINDVCVRWGGDEFVLLLPHTTLDEARALTERIRASLEEHQFEDGAMITCSFGIAGMKDAETLEDMIGKADKSMYIAKKQGKDNALFDSQYSEA